MASTLVAAWFVATIFMQKGTERSAEVEAAHTPIGMLRSFLRLHSVRNWTQPLAAVSGSLVSYRPLAGGECQTCRTGATGCVKLKDQSTKPAQSCHDCAIAALCRRASRLLRTQQTHLKTRDEIASSKVTLPETKDQQRHGCV